MHRIYVLYRCHRPLNDGLNEQAAEDHLSTEEAAQAATQETEVLIVGAGQAGIAMSEHLGLQGIPHLIVERDRIAERWRSRRWDSLVANGPAWHDRFPGQEFNTDPDAFATKDEVADYLVSYAEKIDAPIRTGVEVTSVRKIYGRNGFRVETSEGTIDVRCVVAATGPFQKPIIPAVVPDNAGIHQLHSNSYLNPQQLPAGAVLVVGARSSGVQIADELQRSGRQVYLARRPARPAAAKLSRPRLLLVAGCSRQVGRGSTAAGRRARHHRRERCARRTHRRLPEPGRRRYHAAGTHSLGVHTHLQDDQAVAAGNLLADEAVIAQLLAGYTGSTAASFETPARRAGRRTRRGRRSRAGALRGSSRGGGCSVAGDRPAGRQRRRSDRRPDRAVDGVETTERRLPGARPRPDQRAALRRAGGPVTTVDRTIADGVASAHRELVRLSRDLYDHPETAWEEVRSARRVAGQLTTTGSASPNPTAAWTPPSPPGSAAATCISRCAQSTTHFPASDARAATT